MKDFVARHSKGSKKRSSGASVHTVYLVPADKTPRDDYAAALEEAILEMQAFYQKEFDTSRSNGRKAIGATFNTFSPTVEVVVTSQELPRGTFDLCSGIRFRSGSAPGRARA